MKRIGIVGLGSIGSVHAHSLTGLGIGIAGGVDRSPESRSRFTAAFPDVPVFETLADLLSTVTLEGVIIATPPMVRLEPIRTAVNAGLSVLCEKPLARTLDEARELYALCRDNPEVYIGFCHRYVPAVQTAREILQSGALGELVWITSTFASNAPFMRDVWFTDPAISGGGAAMDNACHALDLCQFLSGEEIAARGSYRKTWEGRGEDSFSFTGKIGPALCSVMGSYASAVTQAFWEIMGTEAVLRYDYTKGEELLLTRANGENEIIPVADPGSRFANQLKAWLSCDRTHLATPSQALRIAELLDQANRDNQLPS